MFFAIIISMAGIFEGENVTGENLERIAAQAAMLLTSPPFRDPETHTEIEVDSGEPERQPVMHRIYQPSFAAPVPIRLDFEIPWRKREPGNALEAQSKRSLSQQRDLMAATAVAMSILFVIITGKQAIHHAFPQTRNVQQIERPSRDPGGMAIYDRLEEIQQRQRQINRSR